MTLRFHLLIGFALLLTTFAAVPSFAQEDNLLAVGVAARGFIAGTSRTDGGTEVNLDWHFGHDRPGWGFQSDPFNWFNTGVKTMVDGQPMVLGQLRMRPLLAGYGYSWIRGRMAITADVLGGFSINSIQPVMPASDEYRTRLGATSVSMDAGNSFAVKPGVHVWYDLSRRVGVRVTGGYLVSRPTLTVTSNLGEDRRRVQADTIMVDFAVVYKIF